jgi:hypothetical protein
LLAKSLKENKKLLFTLHRIQARLRGLIVRKKVRAAKEKRFMPDYNSNKFTPVTNSRIVSLNRISAYFFLILTNIFIHF